MKFDPPELQELAEAVSEMVIKKLCLLPPKNGQTDGLLDVKGIANYLEISRTKVYKMIKENGIPYKRIGGCIRFKKEEVDSYFDSKKGTMD